MTTSSTTATTTSPTPRRRSRRTPEQMLAELQAKLAKVKARAERKAAAASIENSPQPTTAASKRRAAMRAKSTRQPAVPTPSSTPKSQSISLPTSRELTNPLTNSLHAEIRSCVDAFSVDLVDLIQRSTMDAVQSALGELADPSGGGDATGNEPRFSPISARAPSRGVQSAETIPLTFKAYERMAIERALAECGGNVIEAGQRLKMTKSAIYRRIQVLGIRKPSQGGTFEVSPHDPVAKTGGALSLDAYEKAAILRAIDECGGNVVASAKLMKSGKSTMYRRMGALGIPRGS